jgi:hypothetical protein
MLNCLRSLLNVGFLTVSAIGYAGDLPATYQHNKAQVAKAHVVRWRLRRRDIIVDNNLVSYGHSLTDEAARDPRIRLSDIRFIMRIMNETAQAEGDVARFREAEVLLQKYSERADYDPAQGLNTLADLLTSDFAVLTTAGIIRHRATDVRESALRIHRGIEAAMVVSGAPISVRFSFPVGVRKDPPDHYDYHDHWISAVALNAVFFGVLGGAYVVDRLLPASEFTDGVVATLGLTSAFGAVLYLSADQRIRRGIDGVVYLRWANPLLKAFVEKLAQGCQQNKEDRVPERPADRVRWMFDRYRMAERILEMSDKDLRAMTCQDLLRAE